MLDSYIAIVTANPLLSAAVQFAVLGTFGELLSNAVVKKNLSLPCSPLKLVGKMAAWAVLGVFVKVCFVAMHGCAQALLEHGFLPPWSESGLGRAFTLSFLLQLFTGPQIMFFHRFEDNLIAGKWSMEGITTALKSLVWFWLPAHTVTFMLDKPFQIGLAALFSLALGLILGYAKIKQTSAQLEPA